MAITAVLPLIFDAIDTNSDDAIAADEFAAYFASLGVNDKAFAHLVFKSMDSNNDGVLSKRGFSILLKFSLNLIILIIKIFYRIF